MYVLFYCTNPAFGCYILINFFNFFNFHKSQTTQPVHHRCWIQPNPTRTCNGCVWNRCGKLNHIISVTIRPHRRTMYVDAAIPSQTNSSRSVCYSSEPCKNSWTDQDTVKVEDSDRPKEPCITWGFRCKWAILRGKGRPVVKYSNSTPVGLRRHALCEVHTGDTCRIPLNRPQAVATWPVVELL